MWANKGSKRSNIMSLIRTLFHIAASGNFHVSIVHIPGINNCLADALSRLQLKKFRRLGSKAEQDPINHHSKSRLVQLIRADV